MKDVTKSIKLMWSKKEKKKLSVCELLLKQNINRELLRSAEEEENEMC